MIANQSAMVTSDSHKVVGQLIVSGKLRGVKV